MFDHYASDIRLLDLQGCWSFFLVFFFNFPAGSLHCTCTSCPRWPVQCAEMLKTSTRVLSTLVFANSILRSEWCWRFSDGCTADAAGQDDLCTAELALTSYKDRSIPPSSSCSCTTCTRRRSGSYRFVQYALKSLSLHTNHIIVIHFFGFLGKNGETFFFKKISVESSLNVLNERRLSNVLIHLAFINLS